MEVAEQVARASRLIQPDFDVRRHFDKRFDQLDFNFQQSHKWYRTCKANNKKKAFIIEGPVLAMVLRDNYLKGIFRKIVRGCEAVICCEVDAYQKA